MLNSAPVQLLPVDNGSGYKNTASEVAKTAEPKERFDNVFESVVRKDESEKAEISEKDSIEVSRKKESSKPKGETEAVKSRKTQKTRHNEDEEISAVSAGHEAKLKTAVEELKSGLSSKNLKSGDFFASGDFPKTANGIKQFDILKLKVSSAKKEALRGGIKSAGETGFAGFNLKNAVLGKTAEAKDTAAGETKHVRLSEKLGKAAELVKKTKDSSGSVRPSIELVSAAALRVMPSGLTAEQKKSVFKTGKTAAKLKVVDHRQPQSVDNVKGLKTGALSESGSFKSAIDAAGRDFELNPSADLLKSESGKAETRHVQSSVLSHLKDTVNNQIVKQAGIIVKGNGAGEIKLVMKPESLGKVRIQLSLNDNHIAGRIIVENNIVKEIFESNLENLYKAFGSEGFENGGLEVSVQGQGGDAEGNGRKQGRAFNGRAVKAIEEAVPELADSEWRNNAVNMVV